jgi:hypothetical protein
MGGRGSFYYPIIKKTTSPMSRITINGKDYELDSLSQETKGIIANLQFVNSELARMQAMTAILQTAQQAYSNALKAALPSLNGEAAKA